MTLPRRDLLTLLAATTGGVVLGGCSDGGSSKSPATAARSTTLPTSTVPRQPLAAGSLPFPDKPAGTESIAEIEHVVIYMQENHSFDNLLGMLGRGDGLTVKDGRPTDTNPGLDGVPVPMFHMDSTCDLTTSASQTWKGTFESVNGGKMDGFVTSAEGATGSMGYWDESDLPFYYSLARAFPVCDRWFCSAPAQTFPNRRFVQAATSLGIVSTDIGEVLATPDAPNGLIWDRLNDHGISWANYSVDLSDLLLFPNFYNANKQHAKKYTDFLADAAAGTLPQVCLISPGQQVYSEENPHDIQLGEAYSHAIIDAVMNGPGWEKTALFFTYDEHGGYYDHVAPPPAIPPDDIAPRLGPEDPPGAFDHYGPRVPAVVVSPYARKDYVSHVVHDHTSVLKFVETKFNLPALTARDANADDLMDCFDFDHAAFREPPELAKPGLPSTGSTCTPEVAPPPLSA